MKTKHAGRRRIERVDKVTWHSMAAYPVVRATAALMIHDTRHHETRSLGLLSTIRYFHPHDTSIL